MAAAGVELEVDLVSHAVVGLVEVLRKLNGFRRLLRRLVAVACRRQPDVIVLVDYAGFNRRLASAIQGVVRSQRGPFANWRPRLVYYVSPQVWASRPGRALQLERDIDLLLSIFPFEKEWYARQAPGLRVEYVGHPVMDRLVNGLRGVGHVEGDGASGLEAEPVVLLLPGSRAQELRWHLPIMVGAVRQMRQARAIRPWMVLPSEELFELARGMTPVRRVDGLPGDCEVAEGSKAICCRVGGLGDLLSRADVGLAASGSVTVECACYGLPTVVMYYVAWPTYWVARRLVRVPYLAMPNLLAGEEVYPELIQGAATPSRLAAEALALLGDAERRRWIRERLGRVVEMLGPAGATARAAEAVTRLVLGPGGAQGVRAVPMEDHGRGREGIEVAWR
jgi:lipid-A-disaccharide synthase